MSYIFGESSGLNNSTSNSPKQTHLAPYSEHTLLPKGQQVSPLALYQQEPAPMGIADYGIGHYGQPYSYVTSAFQGTVQIGSLDSYSASQHSPEITFQLNVNMYFYNANINTLYVYWIQDVAILNTSTGNLLFIDNIWNISSSSASMYNSTVLGNGTVAVSGNSLFYYDVANNSLPGNNISISAGSTFYLKTYTYQNSRGFPEVDFLYNDGYGWITYDNAVLVFATQLKSTPYFLVDGNIYQPNGMTFYDAELILGGPGGGSQTELLTSDVNLELEYWNGYNFQTIPNAFNFGSDTAEGVFNAVSSSQISGGGELYANVANGSGSLRHLWYSSSLTDVLIYSNIQHGAVILGGTTSVDFFGGFANLSIYPGTYSVQIYNYATGQVTNLGNHTFSALTKYSLNAHVYEVEFSAMGLPPGSVWYVNVTGQLSSGPITGSTYYAALTNGSYSYSITSVDRNYYLASSTGSFTVAGFAITETIQFLLKTYQVTFIEQGLPSGQAWYINLTNGESLGPITTSSYTASLPNSTYGYYIETNDKIYESPGGSFSVSGSSVYQPVSFTEIEFEVTFVESGLPTGTTWAITFNGTSLTSTNDTITIKEPNGSYQYQVGIIHGYNSSPSEGVVTVNGNPASGSISWSVAMYPITLSQSGIPSGKEWSVTLTGTAFNGQTINLTLNSTTSEITFEVPNGTYSYNIHLPSGYSAKSGSQLTGAATVSGSLSKLLVRAQQNPNYGLIIGVVIVVIIAAIGALFLLKRKR